MTLFTGFMVFAVVWWVVWFAVLPFGNRAPERAEPGHVESAPVRPRLGAKAAVTTAVAAVIWGGIYWVIQSGLVTFREGP